MCLCCKNGVRSKGAIVVLQRGHGSVDEITCSMGNACYCTALF